MLPFKKILFPVDFSAHAIGAARYVEAFVGRFGAELILLHVIGPPDYNDLRPDSPVERRAKLASFLAKELEYFRVERVISEGDPAKAILKEANLRNVDLIMMPTAGEGGFRRFLLGSVTAKVLHDADCPVWTGVHLEQAPPLEKIEFRRLLCAVDLDEHSKVVMRSAAELAEEYRASLTVIHVTQAFEAVEEAKRHFEEMLRSMAADATVVVEAGEVASVVSAAASRVHADLMVIGRSAAPGVLGRLRTHAYPIIRQSSCPVISV
jgi:nucleotide-binding universal stress UspA family protein